MSNSEQFLQNRNLPPPITANMWKQVSGFRRDGLEQEVLNGSFRESATANTHFMNSQLVSTGAGNVVGVRLKTASGGIGGGSGWGGPGGSAMQTSEVYSPLWLTSNLNLPRDLATLNAWARSFFALNPIVQNAINLHATYPISKLNIKCSQPDVQKFFEEMIEEIGLLEICIQIAQEYWVLGEAFVYGDWNEKANKWDHLLLQNPDYMTVQRSGVANQPVISMRPDANLVRICTSNKPADVKQRQYLNKDIIDKVRKGQNIPFNNFNMSHLARRISPYETRGTSLIVSSFRSLMLYDKIRECYSEDTEVLTNQGFKKIHELVELSSGSNIERQLTIGSALNDNNELNIVAMKNDFEIACYNSENNNLEYHKPTGIQVSEYSGEMYNFIGKKVDCLVTPEHQMWAKNSSKYSKISAKDMYDYNCSYQFQSNCDYNLGNDIDFVDVCGKKIPIDIYLKVIGYVISEGCVFENFTKDPSGDCKKNRYDASVSMTQLTSSDCYNDMKESFINFATLLDKNYQETISVSGSGYSKDSPKEKWIGGLNGKDLTSYFKEEIGQNGKCKSIDKKIPRWILDLKPKYLEQILYSLVKGDGSEGTSKYGAGSKNMKYSTISKQLADDVCEIVYKLGFVPNIHVSARNFIQTDNKNREVTEYVVLWSDTNYGNKPHINNCTNFRNTVKTNGGGAQIKKVEYDGVVWCFEVPTGLFITRRNGKITIQGNCKFAQADDLINPLTLIKVGGGQDAYKITPADLEKWREVFEDLTYNKNKKLITHDGVTVESVSLGAGIYETSGDITQLMKEIYIGLMVPSVIMDGGGDITYSNGGVALDVLKQRYLSFREMLATWLREKVFKPVSVANGFVTYEGGKETLIVPEVEWNHMSLFDVDSHVSTLKELAGSEVPSVSFETLFTSLGLDYKDQQRKLRKELIDRTILLKEKEVLNGMSLAELRGLTAQDEITEPERGEETVEPPLPGEDTGAVPGEGFDLGGLEVMGD